MPAPRLGWGDRPMRRSAARPTMTIVTEPVVPRTTVHRVTELIELGRDREAAELADASPTEDEPPDDPGPPSAAADPD